MKPADLTRLRAVSIRLGEILAIQDNPATAIPTSYFGADDIQVIQKELNNLSDASIELHNIITGSAECIAVAANMTK